MTSARKTAGFTMLEAIVVIAVLGVISAGLAFFMRVPVLAYVDAESRARLSDNAETVVRRIGRELQSALPNSVRVTNAGGVFYLEFLQTRTGGRYRAAPDQSVAPQVPTDPLKPTCPDTNVNGFADEDSMAFGVPETCFRTIGAVPVSATYGPVVPGDFLVIYNLGPGFTNADAYADCAVTSCNKSQITAFDATPPNQNENRITFTANNFRLDSPTGRFHVVSGPVTFECNPTTGVFNRYAGAGYTIANGQPTPPAAAPDLLAQNVSNCTLTYSTVNQRTGVVSIWLQLTDASGARVNFYQQMLVNNTP